MKIEKMKIAINEIAKINPITQKNINNGYRAEIADKADKFGYIDYKLDNKINTQFGDYRKGNYITQTKSRLCEISLVKSIKQVIGFENVLNAYIKNNKANRYNYIITIDSISYRIVMNKKEFQNFVLTFGRYSQTRNNIRITKSDKTIYKWATN